MNKMQFLLELDKMLSQLSETEKVDRLRFYSEMIEDRMEEGLSEEELAERDKLRRIYIDNVKANLTGQLENTYIVYPDGTKKKVERKQ